MIIEDNRAKLELLRIDHWSKLQEVAAEDKLIQYSPSDIGSEKSLKSYIEIALEEYKIGKSMPFAIYDKDAGAYAGSSRYMNIDRINKVLEIGSTWIGNAFQGTGLNRHIKVLMLDYAYNTMGFEKVEFRIDERNVRSRKAVEKLGAKLEGILRNNVYLMDGYKRNTCCYGILREEWQEKREEIVRSISEMASI